MRKNKKLFTDTSDIHTDQIIDKDGAKFLVHWDKANNTLHLTEVNEKLPRKYDFKEI